MADAKAQNRYRVIERLESGGMAEVFRGEAESLAGFKKAVAIKRVLPHLVQNEKFIRMFLDEARLCARLNHANIVQVFDIGHVDNTYFIVMEFVDGVNLKAVIEHLRGRGLPVPIPVAVYISMQICGGLQYAHELVDGDGAALGIVHRDMSPPNVLISKRGEVKIVDFGLAKASTQLEKSEQGMVKGKFGYLAPETALAEEVNAQADIFAVGIMLWEMIANKRLFFGDTDFATVRLVQQAVIPSLRAIVKEVPTDLEAIVNKALAKDKNERYKTAEQLAQDLGEFLAKHRMAVNSFDIARITKEAIEERRVKKAKEKKPEQELIDKLILEELNRFTSLDEVESAPIEDGSKPVDLSPALGGAKPLDPGGFVDTSDWASGMFDGEDFDPSSSANTSSPSTDLAAELEGDDLSPPTAPPPTAPTHKDSKSSAHSESEPPADEAESAEDKGPKVGSAALADSIRDSESGAVEKKSNGVMYGLVASIVVAAVITGLWFAHIIPHQ